MRPDGWTVESATCLKGASPAQDGSGWGRGWTPGRAIVFHLSYLSLTPAPQNLSLSLSPFSLLPPLSESVLGSPLHSGFTFPFG